MKVRQVTQADYIRLEEAGGYARQYSINIQRWLEKGYITAPDCYIFEKSGVPLGGVCFCDDTDEEREILDFALINISSNGHKYLAQAIQQAAKPNTRKITYNLYNDTEQYADIQRLFCRAGFVVEQEKLRYVHKGTAYQEYPHSLHFKSIAEVGEDQFIDMVERVTMGTLDGLMAEDVKRLGSRRAAKEYVNGLKGIDFNPNWWKLGYAGDTAIGLILPQRFSANLGCINYIGVLPEHRGKGYGLPLLAEGTRILVENGMTEIIADIDKTNQPLAAQLDRLGYVFQMDEVVLAFFVK